MTADPTSLRSAACPRSLESEPELDPANKSRDVVVGMAVEAIISQMKEKMTALSLPRGFAVLPVLIHFSDKEASEPMQDYFYKVIHFGA